MVISTKKLKPDWAGTENLLSRLINLLIRIKPIYGIMQTQARQILIKTAEKNGIPWRQNFQELEASITQDDLKSLTNTDVTYPDYYQVPFHAYEQGNLCWQAAFEAPSATYSMALRVWKEEHLTWQHAHQRLRHSFYQILEQYTSTEMTDILDLGCSVGISTLTLHQYFAKKQDLSLKTLGLDLSPYMLTVAQKSDTQQEISQWIHALGESTGLAANSLDLVTIQFVIHELPRQATREISSEVLRILKPGGVMAILDNNPASPVIQNLPPVLFTLMKSTEPWSDDYYTFNVEAAIKQVGFDFQTTLASDPRHRTIIGIKPEAY
ncbi:MAG: class I SAM-dependent methyltransferase [Cyanobacteria bacterium P01_A01_bin.40]